MDPLCEYQSKERTQVLERVEAPELTSGASRRSRVTNRWLTRRSPFRTTIVLDDGREFHRVVGRRTCRPRGSPQDPSQLKFLQQFDLRLCGVPADRAPRKAIETGSSEPPWKRPTLARSSDCTPELSRRSCAVRPVPCCSIGSKIFQVVRESTPRVRCRNRVSPLSSGPRWARRAL